MHFKRVMIANWLTRQPAEMADVVTTLLIVFTATMSWLAWNDVAHIAKYLSASCEQVFQKHEYWRLWTSLFVHADLGHLLSNALLFVPLSYFLTGYFGPLYFPVVGLLLGGLINLMALSGLDPHTTLVGISGVVYWMGASWLTLYLLIGSRESRRRRIGKAAFVFAALFVPQSFEPHVSYESHFDGFVLGLFSASVYYLVSRARFTAAEVYRDLIEDDDIDDFDAFAGQDASVQPPSAPH